MHQGSPICTRRGISWSICTRRGISWSICTLVGTPGRYTRYVHHCTHHGTTAHSTVHGWVSDTSGKGSKRSWEGCVNLSERCKTVINGSELSEV